MVMKKGTLNQIHVAQTCSVVGHKKKRDNAQQERDNCCFDMTNLSLSSSSSKQPPTPWIAVYGTITDKAPLVVCEELAKATNKRLVLHSFLLNSSHSFEKKNMNEYHSIPLLPVLQVS